MTQAPRSLKDALAQSEAGSTLLQRVLASQRAAAVIESECQRILPDFSPTRSGGCELRGTTLRVNAVHPAQVAKLRQACPRLLRLLQGQGLEVIEIKIGVQPRALSSSERRGPEEQPAARWAEADQRSGVGLQIGPALEFARKLALTLPESPLRNAAARLARSLSAGLARMRESGQAREARGEQDRSDG
jgi:hypothetical protein